MSEMQWWWLSYVDEATDTFAGVVIIEAHGFLHACLKSVAMGLSPGGQVVGEELPADVMNQYPESFRNRLLSRSEAAGELGGERIGDRVVR